MILHVRPWGCETGICVERQRGVWSAQSVCKNCKESYSTAESAAPQDPCLAARGSQLLRQIRFFDVFSKKSKFSVL